MSEKKSLFRKKAIDKLSSPERLDELVKVTSPKLWLALSGLLGLIGVTLVWGIFGRIPTTVEGQGILLKTEGLFKIVARGDAQIKEMKVKPGDILKKDQIVAVLGQKSLEEEIERLSAHLDALEAQHEKLTGFEETGSGLEIDIRKKKSETLRKQIVDLEKEASWLKEKLVTQESLLERGVITKQVVVNTRQDFAKVQRDIQSTRTELVQMDLEKTKVENTTQQTIFDSRVKIGETSRKLAKLRGDLASRSVIKSPKEGRVLELFVANGTVIKSGSPILSIELGGVALDAVIYIPPEDGKNVRQGMEVKIAPSTVKMEEYGYVMGRVTAVSDFPSTPEGMLKVLQNAQLVERLSGKGAPIAIQVDLIEDEKTHSGYKWSSSSGPEDKIHAGTLCESLVVTREQRPITLVIPALKRVTGL